MVIYNHAVHALFLEPGQLFNGGSAAVQRQQQVWGVLGTAEAEMETQMGRLADSVRQMDPAQWAELNQLPPTMQSRWLDIRAEEVKAGKPHAAFNSTKEYQNSPFYGI